MLSKQDASAETGSAVGQEAVPRRKVEEMLGAGGAGIPTCSPVFPRLLGNSPFRTLHGLSSQTGGSQQPHLAGSVAIGEHSLPEKGWGKPARGPFPTTHYCSYYRSP